MYSGKYKIADKTVQIVSVYDEVHSVCAGYVTEEPADYFIEITQSDIEYEREKCAREDEFEDLPVRNFLDSTYEATAVCRKIAEQMIEYDTVLFHGSAVALDGKGYLFTAKSGTGKSTHTRLWREYFGGRAVMINDDKPLIKCADDGITVYGTPFNGKHGIGNNISVPLKAICILTRAEKNEIERISAKEAYPMLLQQVYRPSDILKMQKTLSLVDKLKQGVKLYRLCCNMDISAAKVAYEGMRDEI